MGIYRVTITYHNPDGDTRHNITVISNCNDNAVRKVLSGIHRKPKRRFDIIAKEIK